MRRTTLVLALIAGGGLITAGLYGDGPVDATRPANVTEIDDLLRRLDQLERRVRELEARPAATPSLPYPPVTALPHKPPVISDGVLRADQVKIYMHYQRVIPEVFTAGEVSYPAEPAVFQSGGITITR